MLLILLKHFLCTVSLTLAHEALISNLSNFDKSSSVDLKSDSESDCSNVGIDTNELNKLLLTLKSNL